MSVLKYGILPPDPGLRHRIGGPLKPLNAQQVEEISAAMQTLASGMGDWLKHDLERLSAARNAFLADRKSLDRVRDLHRAAHDLKGLGVTYGYPIVSAIADTLCNSINAMLERDDLPEDLVNAHVDALRAVVNLELRDADSGPAAELLRGLISLAEKKTA